MGRLDEAFENIEQLVERDLAHTQPNTAAFCAAADYFRAQGEYRTSVWPLSKMLIGREPFHPIHDHVIEEGRANLGESIFTAEWERGKGMDIFALYGLLAEGAN